MPVLVWADAPGREATPAERTAFLARYGLPEEWADAVGLEVRRDNADGCWYARMGTWPGAVDGVC